MHVPAPDEVSFQTLNTEQLPVAYTVEYEVIQVLKEIVSLGRTDNGLNKCPKDTYIRLPRTDQIESRRALTPYVEYDF